MIGRKIKEGALRRVVRRVLLEESGSMKVCNVCVMSGAKKISSPRDAANCGHCGSPFPGYSSLGPDKKQSCGKCGCEWPTTASACGSCNAKLPDYRNDLPTCAAMNRGVPCLTPGKAGAKFCGKCGEAFPNPYESMNEKIIAAGFKAMKSIASKAETDGRTATVVDPSSTATVAMKASGGNQRKGQLRLGGSSVSPTTATVVSPSTAGAARSKSNQGSAGAAPEDHEVTARKIEQALQNAGTVHKKGTKGHPHLLKLVRGWRAEMEGADPELLDDVDAVISRFESGR